jgi:hypothetical protein
MILVKVVCSRAQEQLQTILNTKVNTKSKITSPKWLSPIFPILLIKRGLPFLNQG